MSRGDPSTPRPDGRCARDDMKSGESIRCRMGQGGVKSKRSLDAVADAPLLGMTEGGQASFPCHSERRPFPFSVIPSGGPQGRSRGISSTHIRRPLPGSRWSRSPETCRDAPNPESRRGVGTEGQPQCLDDLENRVEARCSLPRKGLVEALSGKTCISSDL